MLVKSEGSGEGLELEKGLEGYLKKKAALVEAALDKYLPDPGTLPPLLHEAMRYSTCGGGKRLRAILALEAAELIGGREAGRLVLPVGCALEMIHAYSLIHDDLPCMDDDDFRRGKPANHKVYGEAMALLAGDALLTRAFEVLAGIPVADPASPRRLLRVTLEVAQAAGSQGMVGGQVLDILGEKEKAGLSALEQTHRLKTGAMIRVSVRAGAIMAGAREEELAALTRFAEFFGLAFQITDDILDLTGDSAKLGKQVGQDLRNDKATYPVLVGLEKARALAAENVEKARESIGIFDRRGEILAALAAYVIERER